MLGRYSKGDTIVEVLFAITVFSLVIVSSFSIMNEGNASAERALEITQVRQEINAQAETLRFLNSSYLIDYAAGDSTDSSYQQWAEIDGLAKNPVSDFSVKSNSCPAAPDTGFVLNTHLATLVKYNQSSFKAASTFSGVSYNSDNSFASADGLWVEAKSGPKDSGGSGYVDFYIRACWNDPGKSAPITLDTVVRLYEPRG